MSVKTFHQYILTNIYKTNCVTVNYRLASYFVNIAINCSILMNIGTSQTRMNSQIYCFMCIITDYFNTFHYSVGYCSQMRIDNTILH